MGFRLLELPPGVPGRLYLHAALGRYRPFPEEEAEALALGIQSVVRLISEWETESKSPQYADAIRNRALRWEDLHFSIPDYGVPSSIEAFDRLVDLVATRLEAGGRVLVHCAAGIGRTGTFAAALLVRLGCGLPEAIARVERAGSQAEDESQVNFLRVFAEGIRNRS